MPDFHNSHNSMSSRLLFYAGSVFVGFLQGLRGFAVPPWSRVLFPRLSLFCAFGLFLFGSLPSFLSCSSGVFAAWWLFFPLGKVLHNVRLGFLIRRWFPWGCVLCCLSPVSLTPPLSWFCFFTPSSFSPSSISVGCVSFEPSR